MRTVRPPSFLIRYGIALAGVAAASAVTFIILHTFGSRPNAAIGYAYLLAIMAAGWWGGYGPGLLACALTFFFAPYLFVPKFTPARTDLNRLALTALVSVLISRVAANRRHTEELLRRTNDELEERVRKRTAELETANTALAEKADELERSNAELEQYTYAASHDLQEPARTMVLYSQLLTRRHAVDLQREASEFVEVIENNARRMLALVDSLLLYSSLVGEKERSLVPVPLTEVVAEAIADSRFHTHAEITCGELPTVHGVRHELVRVFQNLLSNAIKYRAADTRATIAISADAESNMWMVAVRDNGIGIDMQYADRIFKMFKRLHSIEIPGSGMGLAICKKVIEDHGGTIWVESEPSKGATFKFTLPMTRSEV